MIWYCTREDVQQSADVSYPSTYTVTIDRAIESASRAIEAAPLRIFYPTENFTAKYDWPPVDLSQPDRLWFSGVDFISVDTVTAGGVTIPPSDYVLEPANYGPPYTWLQIKDTASNMLAATTDRWQAIHVTGTTGYTNRTITQGVINNVLTDEDTLTGLDVDATLVGVGSLIKLEDEWITIKDRYWSKTGDVLSGDVDKSTAVDTKNLVSISPYCPSEVIRVGSEKMVVETYDIHTGDMTVKRAAYGSTLAAHLAGDEIETLGSYKLERGQCGTVAASHAGDTEVQVWQPPALIRELCIAEAISTVQQGAVGYRAADSSGGAYVPKGETRGAGLDSLRTRAVKKHRRAPVFRPI